MKYNSATEEIAGQAHKLEEITLGWDAEAKDFLKYVIKGIKAYAEKDAERWFRAYADEDMSFDSYKRYRKAMADDLDLDGDMSGFIEDEDDDDVATSKDWLSGLCESTKRTDYYKKQYAEKLSKVELTNELDLLPNVLRVTPQNVMMGLTDVEYLYSEHSEETQEEQDERRAVIESYEEKDSDDM